MLTRARQYSLLHAAIDAAPAGKKFKAWENNKPVCVLAQLGYALGVTPGSISALRLELPFAMPFDRPIPELAEFPQDLLSTLQRVWDTDASKNPARDADVRQAMRGMVDAYYRPQRSYRAPAEARV